MEGIVAEQRIKLALKSRTKSADVFNIPPGDQVLVYREKKKLWDGPFKLYRYDDYKTADVKSMARHNPFSITAVKKYLTEDPTLRIRNKIPVPTMRVPKRPIQ